MIELVFRHTLASSKSYTFRVLHAYIISSLLTDAMNVLINTLKRLTALLTQNVFLLKGYSVVCDLRVHLCFFVCFKSMCQASSDLFFLYLPLSCMAPLQNSVSTKRWLWVAMKCVWIVVLYVIALINSCAIANVLMYAYMCLEGVVCVFY